MEERSIAAALAPALCENCTDDAMCEKHAAARLAIDKMMFTASQPDAPDKVTYQKSNIIPIDRMRSVDKDRAAFMDMLQKTPSTNRITGESYLVTELPRTKIERCKTCKCDVKEDMHGYIKNQMGTAIPCPTCTPRVLRANNIKKIDVYIRLLVQAGKLFDMQNFPKNSEKLSMDRYPKHGDLGAKAQVQIFVDGEIVDIFLTGKPGVGKTGLAIAAGKELASQGKKILVLSSSDYIDLLQENFKTGAAENNIKYIVKNVEVLFLDDLGMEAASAFNLRELQEVVEYRHNAGLKTCITSNLNLPALEKHWFLKGESFQPATRTISRLRGWYEVVEFTCKELR